MDDPFACIKSLRVFYRSHGIAMSVTIPPVAHAEFGDDEELDVCNYYRGLKSNAAFTVMLTIQDVQLFVEGKSILNIKALSRRKSGSLMLTLPSIPPEPKPEKAYVAKWTNILFNQVEALVGSEAMNAETIENDLSPKDVQRIIGKVYASCKAKHYLYPGFRWNAKPTLLYFNTKWAGQKSEGDDSGMGCDVRCMRKETGPGIRDCVGVRRLYLINEHLEALERLAISEKFEALKRLEALAKGSTEKKTRTRRASKVRRRREAMRGDEIS
jgi:hypothetical protein